MAWITGDRPGVPDFTTAIAEETARAVCAVALPALGIDPAEPAVVTALRLPEGLIGRYKLKAGTRDWFVRVCTRRGFPELEKRVTAFLHEAGIPIAPIVVAGLSLPGHRPELRVDIRPFIEGYHFDGSAEGLSRLGSALRKLHHVFLNCPEAASIRANAARRYEALAEARDTIRNATVNGDFTVFGERAAWARGRRNWLARMAEQYVPNAHMSDGAQCVHGQLHRGNVLFRAEDGAPLFHDFEESVWTYVSPAWDLAYVVQRFCLQATSSHHDALGHAAIVLNAYGDPPAGLTDMMRQIAWFAIATMLDLHLRKNIVTPDWEYEKFVQLELDVENFEGRLQ